MATSNDTFGFFHPLSLSRSKSNLPSIFCIIYRHIIESKCEESTMKKQERGMNAMNMSKIPYKNERKECAWLFGKFDSVECAHLSRKKNVPLFSLPHPLDS